MRFTRFVAFTGLAVALAGVTAVAAAEHQPVHVMTVDLPGGGVEQIRYTGDVAPRVLVQDEAVPLAAASFFDTAFGPDSPFSELDRISAEMERQAAVMMRQAALMQFAPDAALQQATLASPPAGATSVTMVSTSNGQGMCTQSVRVTAMGEGKAPEMVRKVSGDCAGGAAPATKVTPTAAPAAKPAPIAHDSI